MRFVLIDRIISFEAGRNGQAIKNVTLSEDFFNDHFPLKPIMPGVLILEGMAQLSGLILEEGLKKNHQRTVKSLLSIVKKAKFRSFAKPGDSLLYTAKVISVNDDGGMVAVKASVEENVIAEASLIFSFHKIDNVFLEKRQNTIVNDLMREMNSENSL